MDLRPKGYSAVFLLLVVFGLSEISDAQNLCSVPLPVILIKENNTIGAVVTTITAGDGVTARISSQTPEGLFSLAGLDLIADTVLDYETFDKNNPHVVNVECTRAGSPTTALVLRIIVEDINDNPPAFAQSQYTLNVDELTKVGTSVGLITATDPDENDILYYSLNSTKGEFELETNFNPKILVKKLLDYDLVKQVTMTLYAQDTVIGSVAEVSHTATTTVIVNIMDIDNRPPWFQPCSEITFGNSKVCMNSGYEGTVNLNQQESGSLTLKPGPILAIDGDNGRKEPIGYTFLGGNDNDIFEINADSGNITMKKPVEEAGPIVLTVMAYQKQNADQFATTTVILKVVISSNFPPKFVKSSYEGFISEDAGVDSLVLESKTSNRPLRVQATDEDFSNGYNPNLRFEIVDGTDFSITPEGFILMAKEVSPGTFSLEMRVVDTTNEESSTAALALEVTPGIPTTTEVTIIPTSSVTTIPTSSVTTTDDTANTQLTDISFTSSAHTSTSATASPATGGQMGKVGDFTSGDMAALGATLAVLVILCLVCIGLLVYRIKGNDADWKKLSEASIFRSSLSGGSAGPKEGMQYSNESFQHDGDSGSIDSRIAADLESKLESGLKPEQKVTVSAFLQTASSPPESDAVDAEKEVKPILTKERRTEEGYKAVWFREEDREDVLIIPDTGEADEEHEEEEEEEDEDEDNLRTDLDLEDDGRLTSM